MRRRLTALPWRGRAGLAVAVVALAAIGLVLVLARDGAAPAAQLAPPLADAVPYDGRSPREPAADEQRVLLALQRPALGRVAGVRDMDGAEQRAYVASLRREAQALRSALDARGVELGNVVAFERTWNGFAATVRTEDLADISSLGVRAQTVRRFYPAVSEPAASGAAAAAARPPAGDPAPIALLASGVAPGPGVVQGADTVDRDADAAPGRDPRDTRRRETAGTSLAGVLTGAGEAVRPLRVAGLRAGAGATRVEEYGTSDELLAGLERAVDPDLDGDTSDRARVALVGVSAPYAGFAASPEAEAVRGATGLGTLVVAPAGHEGIALPPTGMIGSPGAAADALTVGAFGGAPPTVELRTGDGDAIAEAAVLAGGPRGALGRTSAPVTATDPARLLEDGAPRLQGTLAVVRAGELPGAQVAAAAAAGARAVVVAEPRDDRPLTALPAGRAGVPALGVTGAAARALLELGRGTELRAGPVRGPRPAAAAGLAPASSRGPATGGRPKPEIAAPGVAATRDPAGGAARVGGAAVAAAQAAVRAARLARADPDLGPEALRAAIVGGARPDASEAGPAPAEGSGAGRLVAGGPPPPLTADPPTVAIASGRATVRLEADRAVAVRLEATTGVTVAPRTLELRPGRARTVRLRVRPGGDPSSGRLVARDAGGRALLSVPLATRGGDPPPVDVSDPGLERRGDEVAGVRVALGGFDRGDPLRTGTSFQPVERLELELVQAGGDRELVRRLTPPGGTRELLPAEYEYTLPPDALRELDPGALRFRIRAFAPLQRTPTERVSPLFRRP